MKQRIIFSFLVAIMVVMPTYGQTTVIKRQKTVTKNHSVRKTVEYKNVSNQLGKITLNPYLFDNYGQLVNSALTTKLQQIATQNGLAGSGFDDRFIITTHLQPVSLEKTNTAPSKTALRLSIVLYIGDGVSGTLFSSWEKEVRSVGNDETQAYLAAIRNISPSNPDIQAFVRKGCDQIIAYYDNISNDIITKARTLAKSRKHDQAIALLLTIPSSCKAYEQAQNMIAEFGAPAIENDNQEILNEARALWSSSPTESGAAQVRSLLCDIKYPSAKVQEQARKLTTEMSTHLRQEQQNQWEMLMQESQNWHEQEMKRIEGYNEREVARIESDRDQRVATILGAAQVEAAWASRPVINYHVNWW